MNQNALPISENAERAVLGCMIYDTACIPLVRRTITVLDAFTDQRHRRLSEALAALYVRFKTAFDYVALAEYLETAGTLAAVGGMEYLHDLHDSIGSSAHAEYYATVVWRKHLLRESIRALDAAREKAETLPDVDSPADFLYGVAQGIIAIATQGQRSEARFERIIDECQADLTNPTPARYRYGLETLDEILPPMEPGDFIVCGARPSHGKTTLMANVAANVARDPNGCAVAVYSLEVRRRKLARQIVARFMDVSAEMLERGELSPEQESAVLNTAAAKIPEKRLYLIDDCRRIDKICADAAARARTENVGMVLIDYLQLISPAGRHRSRYEEVSDISREVKALAVSEGLVVIALAQLNRELEARPDRMPRASDLRDSGTIEQDADVIILLTRPEMYTHGEAEPGRLLIVRDKVRDGQSGGIFRLGFAGKERAVYDLSPDEREFNRKQTGDFSTAADPAPPSTARRARPARGFIRTVDSNSYPDVMQ